eukprot:SAG31_NODE_10446_length_1137_cov_1.316956_1_plen_95_part_10
MYAAESRAWPPGAAERNLRRSLSAVESNLDLLWRGGTGPLPQRGTNHTATLPQPAPDCRHKRSLSPVHRGRVAEGGGGGRNTISIVDDLRTTVHL